MMAQRGNAPIAFVSGNPRAAAFQRVIEDVRRSFMNELLSQGEEGLKAIEADDWVTLDDLEKELNELDD